MHSLKRRRNHAPDWQDFYKNGVPQEVIVIEDSASPRLTPNLPPPFSVHQLQSFVPPQPPSSSSPSTTGTVAVPINGANAVYPSTNSVSLPQSYDPWLDANGVVPLPHDVASHPSYMVQSPTSYHACSNNQSPFPHSHHPPLHNPLPVSCQPVLRPPPVPQVPSHWYPVSLPSPNLPHQPISKPPVIPNLPKLQVHPNRLPHPIHNHPYSSPTSYPPPLCPATYCPSNPPQLAPATAIAPSSQSSQHKSVNYSVTPSSINNHTAVPLSPTLAVWLPMTQPTFQPPSANVYQPSSNANQVITPVSISDYRPPKKRKRAAWPPYKKVDRVNVPVVHDTTAFDPSTFDDDDGHYKVVPNSKFANRYTVVRLLGHGTFGKVIQCYDQSTGRHCAIKVTRAIPKYREASLIELRVLQTIAHSDPTNENKCIQLRDYFDYRKHICIVTDLFGWSVFDFLKNNNYIPFPLKHIQMLSQQLFKSVAFLHSLGLVHTDLKPENVLLVSNASRTIRLPYRNYSQKVLNSCEIRLIDFGSATFEDEYHSSVVSTRHYRAPEIILGLGWSYPCDVWSIGCILVELFTGQALFQTHEDSEHLCMMEKILGPFDRNMISRSSRTSQRFFKSDGKVRYPLSNTPKKSINYLQSLQTLEQIFAVSSPEVALLLDLLKKVFVYDPKRRITAKEALWHPFFTQPISSNL